MPLLLQMVQKETYLKSKSQVVSVLCNFTRGLINEEDEDKEPIEEEEAQKVLELYDE